MLSCFFDNIFKKLKDPLTVAARRKVVTLGFVDYFL